MIGISLGWDCCAATTLVVKGIRNRKINGYSTCPFDEMVSNYSGVVKCIEDDFKHFCNLKYLSVKKIDDGYLALCTIPYVGDNIVYNSYYKFGFNHESPGHANLYIKQNWEGGINHFVDNNFKNFIERYQRRISNFREYLQSGQHVVFWLNGSNGANLNLLENALKKNYPNLSYEIRTSVVESKNLYTHLKLLGFNDDDDEILRINDL